MKKSLIILSIFVFVSCQPNYNDIERKLETELNQEVLEKDKVVFLMTDYYSEVCVASISTWINAVKNANISFQLIGLYLNDNSRNLVFQDLIDKTSKDVSWEFTSNVSIFELVAEKVEVAKGPYAIKIQNGSIKYIKPVNLFHFD